MATALPAVRGIEFDACPGERIYEEHPGPNRDLLHALPVDREARPEYQQDLHTGYMKCANPRCKRAAFRGKSKCRRCLLQNAQYMTKRREARAALIFSAAT